ncbi:MAG: hypothetical protein ABJB97_10600, partial [Acidobacteriota bacterium]
MRKFKHPRTVLITGALALSLAGCAADNSNTNTTATTTATPPATQVLKVLPRPQSIMDMMKQRGEQDEAKPLLKIVSP